MLAFVNLHESVVNSVNRGLVDGATTLELDNGITSVSTLSRLSFRDLIHAGW